MQPSVTVCDELIQSYCRQGLLICCVQLCPVQWCPLSFVPGRAPPGLVTESGHILVALGHYTTAELAG